MGFLTTALENPSNSLEWMIFLAHKYSGMFLEGTWLTLYIAISGTLLGFILGYVVGIIQDLKINQGDHVLKKAFFKIPESVKLKASQFFKSLYF